MQTTGLPASPSSSRHPSANFNSEKPSHASEPFGDLIHRALISRESDEHAPERIAAKASHSPFEDNLTSKNESASDGINAAKKPPTAARKSEKDSSPVAIPFMGMATPAAPVPPQNQPAGNTHESPGANPPAAPVAIDATKAEVAAADSSETDSAEPAPANLDTQAAVTPETANHLSSPSSSSSSSLSSLSPSPSAESPPPPDAPAPPSAQIIPPKTALEVPPASQADPSGTSAAKQDMTMKKAEKTSKVAGPAEQDLPGTTTTGSEELPKGQKLSPKASIHGSEKLDTAAIESPRIVASTDSPAPTVTVAAATTSPSIDSRVLERTHDIVALHAMRLTDTGSDSLHVVVKPGAGIQLSLELRQSARGIEVSASLHKGDYDQLSKHWPDLQQRLEARGVRVGTLTTSENFTGSHNQSKQQSSNQDPLYAGAFAEFALAGSMTEAPDARAARATAYRGWETWA